MILTRRRFVSWGTTLVAGASVNFATLYSRKAHAAPAYGPVAADPEGRLDLPEGFSYRILQTEGETMSDGRQARGRPDGMAAFAGPDNTVILMRNHEENAPGGGVSRLVLSADTFELISSNDVLEGTGRNCAGGPSPWGWLSCEELAGTGGVWICPTDAAEVAQRVRIDAYGSFKHEAVAVDPDSLVAYLTEDDGDSSLFRMVPDSVDTPHQGQLQAMKVAGSDGFRTDEMADGESVEIEWVDVSAENARADAAAAGAAVVLRGEGIWWFDGSVYFAATTGGQVFRLDPDATGMGGTLTLVTSATNSADNITVAPWGEIFIAEDNGEMNHLHVVDNDGNIAVFGVNVLDPGDEFCGVCFSPDGRAMFVNMQGAGITYVITGPFPEAPAPMMPDGAGGAEQDPTMAAGGDDAMGAGAGPTPATGGDTAGSTPSGAGTSAEPTPSSANMPPSGAGGNEGFMMSNSNDPSGGCDVSGGAAGSGGAASALVGAAAAAALRRSALRGSGEKT